MPRYELSLTQAEAKRLVRMLGYPETGCRCADCRLVRRVQNATGIRL